MRTLTPGTWPFVTLLAMLTAVVAFGIDMSLPALKTIREEFGATTAEAQLTLSIFMLGLAGSQLFYGTLSDRFGRKPILLLGTTVFAVAAVGCMIASSIEQLIAFRLLAGIGAAAAWILPRTIVRDLFEQRQGAQVMGHLGTIIAVVPLIAPTLGGWIMAFSSWRAIFAFFALLGFVLLLATIVGFKESIPQRDSAAMHPGRIVRNYIRFFRTPVCIGHAAIITLLFGGMFSFVSGSPFVLIELFGVPEHVYGYYFAASALSLMLGSWLSSRFARRWPPRKILSFSISLSGVAGATMLAGALYDPRGLPGIALIVVPMMVYALGMGITQPNLMSLVLQPIPDMAGVGSAMVGSMQMAGASLFGYMVGLLYDRTPLAMAGGLAIGGIGGMLLYLLVVRRLPLARN